MIFGTARNVQGNVVMAKRKFDGNLEDMIRAAAKGGELTYISLAPTAGTGPGGIGWAATYSPASKWANGFGRHESDPVEAIKLAMNDDRMGEVINGLRKTLTKGADAGNAKSAAALKGLPEPVDDSDFLS